MAVLDAVDGSSTGIEVPRWMLSKHHLRRSRYISSDVA
jgi:hypothetical protein